MDTIGLKGNLVLVIQSFTMITTNEIKDAMKSIPIWFEALARSSPDYKSSLIWWNKVTVKISLVLGESEQSARPKTF